ncbi:hypothetical protein YB2330_000999 [Saitoella coloradoensis]
MGASDSKLAFRRGVFRLYEERNIPAGDEYWTQFWQLPETASDVFTLFSTADLRRVRDTAPENLDNLILALCNHLFELRQHPQFPHPELAPAKEALNCMRVLTRIIPFVYEKVELEEWEEKFWWGPRRGAVSRANSMAASETGDGGAEAQRTPSSRSASSKIVPSGKPLAVELLDTAIDLLFFCGFTLPQTLEKDKVTYAIWETGVGCTQPIGTTKECETNKIETLRLILAMASKTMYQPSYALSTKGIRSITHIVSTDKRIVLALLCSLLNTVMKYNPTAWRVTYNHVVFNDPRQILVTYSLQLLLALLTYPMPQQVANDTNPDAQVDVPQNNFRYYFSKLHRTQDFQFIVDGMSRILNQPIQASNSYLPGSGQKHIRPEMMMLFWESLQTNRRFRSYLIDTERALDFVVLLLYYPLEHKTDPVQIGLVRMCIFILQTLTAEQGFSEKLNKPFEGHGSLPACMQTPAFSGSYADFMIISIYNLIATSKGVLSSLYPALFLSIANIAPYLQNLSVVTCTKLIQLFTSISSPGFLLANDSNHILLAYLLEAFNGVIENQFHENPDLVYAILRAHRRFESLADFNLEKGLEDIQRIKQKKDEAKKAAEERGEVKPMTQRPVLSPRSTDATFAIGEDDEDEKKSRSNSIADASRIPLTSPSERDSSIGSIDWNLQSPPLRVMSEKARGKLPEGVTTPRRGSNASLASGMFNFASSFAIGKTNFTPTQAWLDSWLPLLPLQTIMTTIEELRPQVEEIMANPAQPLTDPQPILEFLRNQAEVKDLHPSQPNPRSFIWTELAVGWFESMLFGSIYLSEMELTNGAVGVWTGTHVRLFKVQQDTSTPTLLKPKGAVDFVADRLASVTLGLARSKTPTEGQTPAPSAPTSPLPPSQQ